MFAPRVTPPLLPVVPAGTAAKYPVPSGEKARKGWLASGPIWGRVNV